jgi:hypothetical protein
MSGVVCQRRSVLAMLDWVWSDPRWRDRVGNDVPSAAREAVRRAVDLRDTLAEAQRGEATRAVFLVAVLNHLCEQLAIDTTDLWDRS